MKAIIVFCGFSLGCIAAFSQQLATTNITATPKIKRDPVWFQKYDTNKNGVLDPDERRALETDAENQRRAFILSMDKNGDGKIDSHEQWLAKSNRLTDQAGSLVRQQYGYRAFGSERFSLSLDLQLSFTSRFTGQPYDADTGLYYYQSRYYDPELGRFVQPDTIVPDPGSSQSLNRYSYVLNNPLKYIDPTGHREEPVRFVPSGHNWLVGGVGTLGFGAGRDWLGLGYEPGSRGGDFGNIWARLGFPDMNDVLAGSPSVINPYASASFRDKWRARRAQAFEDLLKTAASTSLMALPFGGPMARVAAEARIGVRFAVTRMEPIIAKGAATETAATTATQLEFQFAPQVEQYALRAAKSGFYPVLVRGSREAQFITYLQKGDVWKFGTTVNPATRYSPGYLKSVGEHGVTYSTEFLGTEQQAIKLQNMKILNHLQQKGRLPPGNKIIN